MNPYSINKCDYGIRNWRSYAQPYQFNIVVNEMQDVKRHDDKEFAKTPRFDAQSSCGGSSFRVSL